MEPGIQQHLLNGEALRKAYAKPLELGEVGRSLLASINIFFLGTAGAPSDVPFD